MSREALVLLVCCCDFRDRAERLIPSKSLRNAVIWAFPGLLCILRMCAPRRAAAVLRPRGREKSADRRRRILISRLLIIRASVPRRKSPFPAYFKGFPAVSPLIPPYPTFLKYPVSPHHRLARANTPDSVSFRRFLLFSPWRAPASLQRNVARQHRREYADSARLRLKKQKSLENPSLAGAEQFCRSRNVSRQEKTRREYLPYCQGA